MRDRSSGAPSLIFEVKRLDGPDDPLVEIGEDVHGYLWTVGTPRRPPLRLPAISPQGEIKLAARVSANRQRCRTASNVYSC